MDSHGFPEKFWPLEDNSYLQEMLTLPPVHIVNSLQQQGDWEP
jgi:hypothetical protein